jgi:hypothetical protein
MNMIRIETFLLGEGVDEVVGKIVEIASALRDDGGKSITRGLAWAQRILVGVDTHPIVAVARAGGGGQHRLGDYSASRGGGGKLQE